MATLAQSRSLALALAIGVRSRPGDRFYVIVEGEVEITRRGTHVSEQGPGAYVGEIACCATFR